MLIIALIAGRGAEDPAISVVTMLTDCPSGLDSQKRLSLWVEAGLVCALQFWDKTGSGGGGGEGQNGSEKVGGQADPNEGEKGMGERPPKSHLQPCKEPSGGGQ